MWVTNWHNIFVHQGQFSDPDFINSTQRENVQFSDKYPLHTLVWWYKTWYQVEPVVWTSITTWYKVLYHHTTYVISLSIISIKTNFKQIIRFKLKFVQYSQGDYILWMTLRYFFPFFHQCQVTVLCLTFQWHDIMSK
jgi:hypothetical protein